jgi:hypothetical protein
MATLKILVLQVGVCIIALAVALFAGMNLYMAYRCMTRRDEDK